MENQNRESLGSRLGFLLLSAGCAIGLGNVWRFPYITGKYGGAAFVLIYLVFLVIIGLPVMVCEFAVGRASRKSMAAAFEELEPQGKKWHWYNGFAVAGNYLLMMFYTVVSGWFLKYFFQMAGGKFVGMDGDAIVNAFVGGTVGDYKTLLIWMLVVIVIGFGACFLGLQKGVERITKIMMSALFVIMVGLAIYVAFLKGAGAGYAFYLKPDFKALVSGEHGLWDTIYAAMGQAFFTLSLGIGSMEIFGSYIDKKYSLTGEALRVIGLDTFVAICAGLIIFPACAAFDVEASSGAGLAFMSLPNVFNSMGPVVGRIVGAFFFLFMSFAALSTVIAVFENIVAFPMDKFGWSRSKSVLINFIAMIVLATPAALGMNIWSGVHFGAHIGSIDALEDFIVSQNLLPLGSLIFLLFCTVKAGWGWDGFTAEADTGDGIKFPKNALIKVYLRFIAPVIILVVFVAGYIDIFGAKTAPIVLVLMAVLVAAIIFVGTMIKKALSKK
ncbi:MAG: sodium-dependent transporter [Treponema sp.]|nr:sodium-dependent transporter [Treponema sp.]